MLAKQYFFEYRGLVFLFLHFKRIIKKEKKKHMSQRPQDICKVNYLQVKYLFFDPLERKFDESQFGTSGLPLLGHDV